MSAIFGVLRFDGLSPSAADIERMGNVLAHRGPDRRKIVVEGPVGVGHGLLRVNREDFSEAQPARDRDAGLLLVADARIDNREALAETLGIDEDALAVLPDSAVILAAWRRWGAATPEHLLGDFALAIYDARRGELHLARDPLGQRTIFYHHGDRFLAFATEIKALFALTDIPRRLCEAEIGRELMLQVPAGDGATFFEGVTFPSGGQAVRIDATGRMETRAYWEPHADPAHIGRDEAYYIDTYRRLITEAVDCRVRRTIAPPALLMSAGFDSGAIAGLAQERMGRQGRKLLAFSSVLPEDYSGPHTSVRPWVEACKRVMPHLDVRYFVQSDETIMQGIERACDMADGPGLTAHYLCNALFREAARSGARLVMDGIGGDGTINMRLGNTLADLVTKGRLLLFLREFRAQVRAGDFPASLIAINTLKQLLPDWLKRAKRPFRRVGADRFIARDFAEALLRERKLERHDYIGGQQPNRAPDARMMASLHNWIGRNRRLRANEAAAHGLDLTRPFFDRRIVEFALAIPVELYIKDGRHRWLGQKALADIYPPEFQCREARQDEIEPIPNAGLLGALPQVEAEFARLAADPALRRYIDFDRLTARLSALRDMTEDQQKTAVEGIFVRRTLLLAKFIERARGDNRTTFGDQDSA